MTSHFGFITQHTKTTPPGIHSNFQGTQDVVGPIRRLIVPAPAPLLRWFLCTRIGTAPLPPLSCDRRRRLRNNPAILDALVLFHLRRGHDYS